MRLKYSFEINEESEFSSENVAVRNKDDDAIIVSILNSNKCLLMLNKGFLDKFSLKDEVEIYGESLCPLWGYNREYILFYGDFVNANDDYISETLFRCRVVEYDQIDQVSKDIKNARLFLENKQKQRSIVFIHTIEK